MMLLKCCTQYTSKFGKLSSGHRTGKGQFSFRSQRRTLPNNVQSTIQPQSLHMLARSCSKIFQLGFNSMWTENTLFQQHKRRLYTLTSPDGQHRNQIDYILYSQRWRSSIQSTETRPGADCVSDHELLIAKFRLKLKKVGTTTRPFRYDVNQIPYDYTMEVTNRFKGLDLID